MLLLKMSFEMQFFVQLLKLQRLRMSDSDDDWTGFLGEQTDSEDDQPIRAKHIMQDRKRKISSSNQPKISKKSKTDFEVSFE